MHNQHTLGVTLAVMNLAAKRAGRRARIGHAA
jgi:hypothetical protein